MTFEEPQAIAAKKRGRPKKRSGPAWRREDAQASQTELPAMTSTEVVLPSRMLGAPIQQPLAETIGHAMAKQRVHGCDTLPGLVPAVISAPPPISPLE